MLHTPEDPVIASLWGYMRISLVFTFLISPSCLYVYGFAYFCVHSLAVAMAAASSSFQLLATSGARGSSGLGAPRRAWIESRIVRICSAGDQLSEGSCKSYFCRKRSAPTSSQLRQTYSSTRPGKCDPACQRWGGRSW